MSVFGSENRHSGGKLPALPLSIKVLLALGLGLLISWLWASARESGPVTAENLRPVVAHYCRQYGVEPAMVMAVIRAESSGRPDAVSRAGAIGLMQIMPETGDYIASKLGEKAPSRSALMEPERNIRFGVYYFSMLQQQFGLRTEVLLAAYNAGPTRVQRWLSANQDRDAVSVVMNCPIPETRVYIRRVLGFIADGNG